MMENQMEKKSGHSMVISLYRGIYGYCQERE